MSQLAVSPEKASPPGTPTPYAVPWGWWDIGRAVAMMLGGILFLFLLLFIALVILQIGGVDIDGVDNVAPTNVVIIGFYAIMLLATYWCTVRRYASTWAALGVRRVSWWWLVASPACFSIMFIVILAIQKAMSILMGQPFQNPQVQTWTHGQQLRPIDLVLLLLCLAVGAPIVEELFFRGMLYPVLRRHAPAWIAIVANAGIFAVLHFTPIILLTLFVSGLVFALVRERTGSLLPGMFIHALQNALFVITLYAAFHSG